MAVTLVVWNVETFGDRWNAARGANYAPVCNFMAQALYAANADILVMMELRKSGSQYLPTLRAALNQLSGNAWTYDFIPGSVVSSDPNAITLGYTQQGHAEGYAVLWRTDHPEFSVLRTRVAQSGRIVNGISRIGLVFRGRTSNPNVVVNGWYNAPHFDPVNPPAPWLRLNFLVANPIHKGDNRWNLCRRPCYVVLNLTRPLQPRTKQLLPIVVFHATNHKYSTPWSVQSHAYSAQLYQVDDTNQANVTMVSVDQAIAAGDFNIDHNDRNNVDWDAYTTFTEPFANGGAGLQRTWVGSNEDARNLTAVRLTHRDGTPITTDDVNDYRWLAIDNLFSDGLTPVTPPSLYRGPVYNLLGGLKQNGFLVNSAAKRRVIRSFDDAVGAALGPRQPNGSFQNYPR
ncbi:MAG TPA: hypothetical protein VMA95_22360, partial [Streptosporangiaceae bacterium]|nr:hypothetical protein [Streptosporangiaceae bacterium]